MSETRKAGEYVIIHEMRIGEKEIVVGEKPYDDAEKYMCSYYKETALLPDVVM